MVLTASDVQYPRQIGPQHLIALPFIENTGEKCLKAPAHTTNAFRYLQGASCIFITHLRWIQAGEQREMSRSKIVDQWVAAMNLLDQQVAARHFMRHARRGDTKNFHLIDDFRRNVQLFHPHISTFFAELALAESSGCVYADWLDRDLPIDLQDLSAKYQGLARPGAWPLLLFDAMRVAMTDPASVEALRTSKKELEVVLLDLYLDPPSPWRGRVEALGMGDKGRATRKDERPLIDMSEPDDTLEGCRVPSIGIGARSWVIPRAEHAQARLASSTSFHSASIDDTNAASSSSSASSFSDPSSTDDSPPPPYDRLFPHLLSASQSASTLDRSGIADVKRTSADQE